MAHSQYVEWDQETRTEAVRLYVEHGAAEASRQTSVPARTIRRWASEAALSQARDKNLENAGARLQAQMDEMRLELRVGLIEQALRVLERMREPHTTYHGKDAYEVTHDEAPAADLRGYAITLGILIDKYRLESGESTDRTEHAGGFDITVNGVDINRLR